MKEGDESEYTDETDPEYEKMKIRKCCALLVLVTSISVIAIAIAILVISG